jgi:malonate decarboxylase gamma subunit
MGRGGGHGPAGAPVTVDAILRALFPGGHDVRREGDLLLGTGPSARGDVAVIGICDGAEIGVEASLRLSAEVLRLVREHPGRPLLTLVDTAGQRMSKRDEILGLNGCLAHLAACVELARIRGHRIVALVHGQAASGSFLALGMMADEIHAMQGASLSVMNLRAMSRVTRIPLERLESLSAASPVLAPGLDNYVRLGCVASVWEAPLSARLDAALARPAGPDRRAENGQARGGRTLAARVARRVSGEAVDDG